MGYEKEESGGACANEKRGYEERGICAERNGNMQSLVVQCDSEEMEFDGTYENQK